MNVEELPKELIPRHIAIIMDGNRRWAREKGVPEIEGHRQGVEAIRPVVKRAGQLGVKHLTFWAWSTENWKRNQAFVSQIMAVFRETLKRRELFEELVSQAGELHIFGDLSKFPGDIQKMIKKYLEENKPSVKKIDVNFALNYGGRAEILRAVRQIIRDGVKAEDLDEDIFSSYLYTRGQADVDLLIRTGGEKRVSGFLPWQSVYAEYYFTKTYWPDFAPAELDKAVFDFASRDRRFGGDSAYT